MLYDSAPRSLGSTPPCMAEAKDLRTAAASSVRPVQRSSPGREIMASRPQSSNQ